MRIIAQRFSGAKKTARRISQRAASVFQNFKRVAF
jgi:hypothetical protein